MEDAFPDQIPLTDAIDLVGKRLLGTQWIARLSPAERWAIKQYLGHDPISERAPLRRLVSYPAGAMHEAYARATSNWSGVKRKKTDWKNHFETHPTTYPQLPGALSRLEDWIDQRATAIHWLTVEASVVTKPSPQEDDDDPWAGITFGDPSPYIDGKRLERALADLEGTGIEKEVSCDTEKTSAPKNQRKKRYDWDGAEKKLRELFEYHGDFTSDDPEWSCQADAERAVADWFSQQNKPQPGESTIRDYVRGFLNNRKAGRVSP